MAESNKQNEKNALDKSERIAYSKKVIKRGMNKMFKVIWSRYGRFAGEKVFEDRPSALKFFHAIRGHNGVSRAELKAI